MDYYATVLVCRASQRDPRRESLGVAAGSPTAVQIAFFSSIQLRADRQTSNTAEKSFTIFPLVFGSRLPNRARVCDSE